jgi:PQQ-like domain
MKKSFLMAFSLMMFAFAPGQEFPVAWKSKFAFTPDRWFYDGDAKYVLGRNEEQAEVLDGATGQSIWKLNFKNDLKVKTLSRATYNEKEGLVLFYNEDEKKKNGEKVVVDLATGKELWRGDAYAGTDADDNFHFANSIGYVTAKQSTMVFNNTTKKFVGLDVRTGKVKWESSAYPSADLSKNITITEIENSDYAQVFIMDQEDLLKTQIFYMNVVTGEVLKEDSRFTSASADNYEKYSSGEVRIKRTVDKTVVRLTGKMKELGFKIKFELEASGDVTWKKNFEGSAVRQIWKDRPYVKLDVQGDKIFVLSKHITVFDLKTGNQLWQEPFDNCDASAGLKAKQEFGIAGWPLVNGNDAYYVDLQKENAIKKVEVNTGKLIWKSDKLKSNDRVPNLTIVSGVLVAQFGGLLNTQLYIPNSNGGGTYKSENRFDGNFEVRGYDPATGKMLWNTSAMADKLGDKFKDRISTIYPLNNNVVVASGENLLCLEPKTGNLIYKTSLSEKKIGPMFEVIASQDYETLYVFCENGIAKANPATGKLDYATKTGEISWKLRSGGSHTFTYGNNMFVWVGDKDFIGFDLASGAVKGKMTDNDDPQMTNDGNYILVRDGGKVTKYAVNK